jgi:hypothetical protein
MSDSWQPSRELTSVKYEEAVHPFSKVAFAVTAGTLGIGGQMATPLAHRANLRVGANFFTFNSANYTDNGINFAGTLKLQSAQATIDWFPFGRGFHLSPGVLMYNGLKGSANLYVPGGQGFELNKVDYISDPTNPVTGTGTFSANRTSPMLLIGTSNLVPRSNRHITVPFEIGGAYQGVPKVAFGLAGSACDTDGNNCGPVATNTELQANLAAQRVTINNDVAPYRVYPVISIGFGYKF